MKELPAGLAIWRRNWRRALLVSLLPSLPMFAFIGLSLFALHAGNVQAKNPEIGVVAWMMLLAPFADQIVALPVYRAECARRAGVPPRSWTRPRSIGWCALTAALVTVLLGGALMFGLLTVVAGMPVLALLAAWLHVAALVAGVEQRATPEAIRRSFRLSKGFRWSVIGTAAALWAGRWLASVFLTMFHGDLDGNLDSFTVGVIAAVALNVVLSGLFASVSIANYERMAAHHDDVTGALGRVFE